MAESAETNDANFLAFADSPMEHGRTRRNSGAEEGRCSGKIKIGGDAQHEPFIDVDAIGVASVGDASEVRVRELNVSFWFGQKFSIPAL